MGDAGRLFAIRLLGQCSTGGGLMMVSVRIPVQIRRLYGAQSWERVETETAVGVIAALDAR